MKLALLSMLFSVSAQAAPSYWWCVSFLDKSPAAQAAQAKAQGFDLRARQDFCWNALRQPVPSGGPSQEPALNCSNVRGKTECAYDNQAPALLNCGTPAPGSSSRCYDQTGRPTRVSCYTNLSGYTSCN